LKKLFFIYLFIFVSILKASNIDDAFNSYNDDLKILQELDLKSSYITNEEFQDYYNTFNKRYARTYTKKLQNAQVFIPLIKKTLVQNNIPASFMYMAMAESNFQLKAKSYMKAVGIWQFMPVTAKKYGLKMDYYIDERMDIVKSTNAAAKYLNTLHRMLGKWYLAALAYNCGEARVIEGLTRASLDMYCKDNGNCKKDPKIREYRHTIKLYQERRVGYQSLHKVYKKTLTWNYEPNINQLLIVQDNLDRQYIPKESRNYIKKIISLAMMGNSNELSKNKNHHLSNTGYSSSIVAVKTKGGLLLKTIAKAIDMPKKDLIYLNPHILRTIIPLKKEKTTIYIPYEKLSLFKSKIKGLKRNEFLTHKVKSGDTLSHIAALYGTRVKIIKDFNNLKSNRLRIRQRLLIPVDPDTYKKPKVYIVKAGDSLYKIARKFKVPLKKLKKYNTNKYLHVGDKIVVSFK
jgi:membrane-bound lytic murein transglycosylase D